MKNTGSERNSGEKQQSELASCIPERQLQTNGTDFSTMLKKVSEALEAGKKHDEQGSPETAGNLVQRPHVQSVAGN